MQSFYPQHSRWVKPAMAGLMAAIVLALALFASSERLHHAFHQDATSAHPVPCAACSLAQGQVELPGAAVSEVFAPLSVAWTIPSFSPATTQEADFYVASSRGPPVSISSL